MKRPRCSHCGKPRDRDGQRYCRLCHAAYQRWWRRGQTFALKDVPRETRAFRETPLSVGHIARRYDPSGGAA